MRKHIRECIASLFMLLIMPVMCSSQDWTRMSGITDQFYHIVALWDSDTLVVHTLRSGTFWSSDAGFSLQALPTPSWPGSLVLFRRQGQFEIIMSTSVRPYLQRSTNFGLSWEPASEQIPDYTYLRLLLDVSQRLWAFKRYYLYYSDDFGMQWDSLAAPGTEDIRDLWVSAQNSSILWLVTNGALYSSEDRGISWALCTPPIGGVSEIEGNPQNPYSVIAICSDSMRWNHGDGTWYGIPYPFTAVGPDVSFLGDDSTRLLACGGTGIADNIMRSDDGGGTWRIDCGAFIGAAGLTIQRLDPHGERVAVTLPGGALLGDSNWEDVRLLRAGTGIDNCTLSMHQIGLIWASSNTGTFVSSNAGQDWINTPFVSSSLLAAEHTGRTAAYILKNRCSMYLLDFPSLACEQLSVPPESPIWFMVSSEADTCLLYCLTENRHLYVSRDGAQSWQQVGYPGEPYGVCMIHPSSSVPGFAFLASTSFSLWWWYPSVWRTEDFGETWELVFQTDFPNTNQTIMESWSGRDALTDFNFRLLTDPDGEYWYYYSLDGGVTFDSLRTAIHQSADGYVFSPWGDSLAVVPYAERDSIYISPDRGRTLEFRLRYPEGEQTRLLGGRFSQLISLNDQTGKAFYHGPYSSAGREIPLLPQAVTLRQNYPNPFNTATRIIFDLPTAEHVSLKVYDLLGREVAVLADGMHAPGQYSVLFDGSDLPSGIYIYRIETGSLREAKKMVLLK
jgi:hypothetical protein